MGVRQAVGYHLGKNEVPLAELMPTLLAMVLVSGAIGMSASLAYYQFAGLGEVSWTLQLLAVAVIPLGLLSSYLTGIFLGLNRVADFRRVSWRPALLNLCLVAALLVGFGFRETGVLLGAIGGSLLGAAYALYFASKFGKIGLGWNGELVRRLQRKGLGFALPLMAMMLNYRVMTLLLSMRGSLADVGIYIQAITLAEMIWEVPNTLASVLLARGFSSRDATDFSRKVLVLVRLTLVLGIGMALGMMLFGRTIIHLLFGAHFDHSADVLFVLLPGIVAFLYYKVLNVDLATRGRPMMSLVTSLPILCFSIIAGWWAIGAYGVMGGAWVTSLGYCLGAIIYVFVYRRETGIGFREILLPSRLDIDVIRRAAGLRGPQ